MRRLRSPLLAVAFAITAVTQVYSPKVLLRGQPDASDLRSLVEGIYAQAGAHTPRERAEAIWRFFLTDGRFVKPGFWYHIAGWAYEEPMGGNCAAGVQFQKPHARPYSMTTADLNAGRLRGSHRRLCQRPRRDFITTMEQGNIGVHHNRLHLGEVLQMGVEIDCVENAESLFADLRVLAGCPPSICS